MDACASVVTRSSNMESVMIPASAPDDVRSEGHDLDEEGRQHGMLMSVWEYIAPDEKSRKKRKDPTHVPQPNNMWIMFRRWHGRDLKRSGINMKMREATKRAAQLYKNLPKEKVEYLRKLQAFAKKVHM